MLNETKRKLWIGVLATSGAALFLFSIFLIGKKQNMFGPTFRLYAVFSNINGLKTGNYVRLSGVRAGIVDNITVVNDSVVVVELKLNRKLQPMIKKDDIIFISTEGLVGDKILEIKRGRKSKIPVGNNDTLASVNPYDTHDIIDKLLATNDNAKIITANLAKLSTDINTHKSILKTVVADSLAANDFRDIISNLKSTGQQFNLLAGRLNEVSGKINSNKGLTGTLLNDTNLVYQLHSIMDGLQQASNNAASITRQLNQSMLENYNRNTLSMLMKDSVLAGDLKQAIENLKESTRKLDTNMDALQHSFLLRGYFKKKNKK
jgi:phospholipid/cholesterol/gamma-HCH transport system substrate-binding protein